MQKRFQKSVFFTRFLCYAVVFALSVGVLSFSQNAEAEASGASYDIRSYSANDINLEYVFTSRASPEQVTGIVSSVYYMKYSNPFYYRIRFSGHNNQFATGVVYFYANVSFSVTNAYDVNKISVDNVYHSVNGYTCSVRLEPLSSTTGTLIVVFVFDNYKLIDSDYSTGLFNLYNDVTNIGSAGDIGTFTCPITAYGTGGMSYSSTSGSGGNVADQVAAGINSSSDIDSIISLLNAISFDTDLLSQVVSKLDNINEILSTVYTELQSIDNKLSITNNELGQVNDELDSVDNRLQTANTTLSSMDQNMINLGWALAGVNIDGMTGNQIAEDTFNRWVSIIKTALDDVAPDTSNQEQELSGVQDQANQLESGEQQVYDFNNSAMSDIDFNVSLPAGIASAAVTIMGWLASFWGQLGDLQFLVTSACLVGLITIVLGVVNRFVGRGGGSSASGRDSPMD